MCVMKRKRHTTIYTQFHAHFLAFTLAKMHNPFDCIHIRCLSSFTSNIFGFYVKNLMHKYWRRSSFNSIFKLAVDINTAHMHTQTCTQYCIKENVKWHSDKVVHNLISEQHEIVVMLHFNFN